MRCWATRRFIIRLSTSSGLETAPSISSAVPCSVRMAADPGVIFSAFAKNGRARNTSFTDRNALPATPCQVARTFAISDRLARR